MPSAQTATLTEPRHKRESKPRDVNKKRRVKRGDPHESSGERPTSQVSGFILSDPTVIPWQNKEAFVYAVDSRYNKDAGADLEFVIYIPIDKWVVDDGDEEETPKPSIRREISKEPEQPKKDSGLTKDDNGDTGQERERSRPTTTPVTTVNSPEETSLRQEFRQDAEEPKEKSEDKGDDIDWETGNKLEKATEENSKESGPKDSKETKSTSSESEGEESSNTESSSSYSSSTLMSSSHFKIKPKKPSSPPNTGDFGPFRLFLDPKPPEMKKKGKE